MKLSIRQKKFADEYIISTNILQSAIKAGYSKNYANSQAHKLLENVGIKSYIDEQLEKISSKKIADAQEVMEYLTSVVRGESKSSVVVVLGAGDGVSKAAILEKPPDEKEKLKAAELLGKRYGIFNDKVNLEIEPITIVNDLKE